MDSPFFANCSTFVAAFGPLPFPGAAVSGLCFLLLALSSEVLPGSRALTPASVSEKECACKSVGVSVCLFVSVHIRERLSRAVFAHAHKRTHTHTHTPGGGSDEQVGGGFFLVSAS